MRRPLGIGLALIALAACGERGGTLAVPEVSTLPNGVVEVKNSGPSAWADTAGWKLVELYRVGGAAAEGTGPAELVNPRSVALEPAGGIYVSDQRPAVIKQFGPTGNYVRSFGREGGGPGEFQVAFVAAGFGAVVVHDPRAARTSVFDSTGTFVRSWVSSCCYWSSIPLGQDSIVYIPSADAGPPGDAPARRTYLRFRLDGTLVDTFRIANPATGAEPSWVVRGGSGGNRMMFSTTVPLAAGTTWAVDPAGGAVFAWSGQYQFVNSRTGLDTARIVYLTATATPVGDERRTHLRDSMVSEFGDQVDRAAVEEAFKVSDIPTTAPYFESIQVDGRGHRWVRRDDGGNPLAARFDVFDSTGAYLGAVPVPPGFGSAWQTVWGADRVATITEDEEGLPVVVVYKIERR